MHRAQHCRPQDVREERIGHRIVVKAGKDTFGPARKERCLGEHGSMRAEGLGAEHAEEREHGGELLLGLRAVDEGLLKRTPLRVAGAGFQHLPGGPRDA